MLVAMGFFGFGVFVLDFARVEIGGFVVWVGEVVGGGGCCGVYGSVIE